LLKELVEKEVS